MLTSRKLLVVSSGIAGLVILIVIILNQCADLETDSPRTFKGKTTLADSIDAISARNSVPSRAGILDVKTLDALDHSPVGGVSLRLAGATRSNVIISDVDGSGSIRVSKSKRPVLIAEKHGYLTESVVIPKDTDGFMEILVHPIQSITCRFRNGITPVAVKGSLTVLCLAYYASWHEKVVRVPSSSYQLTTEDVEGSEITLELPRQAFARVKIAAALEQYSMVPQDIDLNAHSANTVVDILVAEGVACTGRVVNEDLQPISAASIVLEQDGVDRAIKSDETGLFSCAGFRSDEVRIHAWAKGYDYSVMNVNTATSRFVEVILMRRNEVTLKGRVTDATGVPLTGATIRCMGFSATSKDDGTFQLNFADVLLKDGFLYLLSVTKKGFAEMDFKVLRFPLENLDVTMHRSGNLNLLVQGMPPQNGSVLVKLVQSYVPADANTLSNYTLGYNVQAIGEETTTSLDLLPGRYQISVFPGTPSERTVFADVQAGKDVRITIKK